MMLKKLVRNSADGNHTSTLQILTKFQPLLKKYAALLNYSDAYSDLQCTFLSALPHIAENPNIQSDDQIAAYYLKKVILHAFYKYSTTQSEILFNNCDLDEDADVHSKLTDLMSRSTDDYTMIEFYDIFIQLSDIERLAVVGIILNGSSAAELARNYGSTRQAINQAKQRGLKKIKSQLLSHD